MLRILVATLALGCTSSSPSEYHQGAYRPPPALRPGHGAPVVGQPGQVRPGVQVQPNPRLPALPHTPQTRREDTIWAATPPEPGSGIVFNWSVPTPENDGPAAERIRQCAEIMKVASPKVLHKYSVEQFDRINVRWRLCWPHAAVDRCLAGILDAARNGTDRATLRRARDFVERELDAACSGNKWSPGFDDAIDDAWRKR